MDNNALQLLRKNAPYVYMRYKNSKSKELRERINDLRIKYAESKTDAQRLEIKNEAFIIKKRLEELT